jgi:hypothetical protein
MSVWFYKSDGTDLFKAGIADKLDDYLFRVSAQRESYLVSVEDVKEAIARAGELEIPPEVVQVLKLWTRRKADNELLWFYVE